MIKLSVSRRSSTAAPLALGTIILGIATSGLAPVHAETYAAIWDKSSGPAWVARHGLSASAYQAEFDKLVAQGYRLKHVSGYTVGGEDRYAAIWDKSSGPQWAARHGLSSSAYQAEFDKLVKQGYRLKVVSGYGISGSDRYAAIWEKASGPAWVARHGLSSSAYQQEFEKLVGQGYRLKHVSGYNVGGEERYAAIWDKSKGPNWIARHGLSSSAYQTEFDKLNGQGYRLTHVSGYKISGEDRYAAIWLKGSSPAWVARHGLSSSAYQAEFDKLTGQGYRLKDVSGD